MFFNIYKYHTEPETLDKFQEADMNILEVFWHKYNGNDKELLKRRKAISKHPSKATYFAHSVLNKERFPEGESAISTDYKSSYLYAKFIIKGPWPKGEKAIAEDPEYAYKYSKLINDKFSEGEDVIMGSSYAGEYLQHLEDIGKKIW